MCAIKLRTENLAPAAKRARAPVGSACEYVRVRTVIGAFESILAEIMEESLD
jgi:hypothetical protein